MLALMLDPMFKSLKVVENYVGCGACICIVAKYDANTIIPLLMTMFEVLNLIVQACVVEVGSIAGFGDSIGNDNNIFNVGASNGKDIMHTCCCRVVLVQEVIYIPCYMC
jgi:hypothetical protein